MWVHKRFISPICKPPKELKGQLAYLQRKTSNLSSIYGSACSSIPPLIFGMLTSDVGVDKLLFSSISIFILIWLIRIQSYRLASYFCASAIFAAFLLLWKSPDQLQAYFFPAFGLLTLFGIGVSRTLLTMYFLFVCCIVWFHSQTTMKNFFQTATREEIEAAIQRSLLEMMRIFLNLFCQTLVKSYTQEKLYLKAAVLKQKIAEQNEALKISNNKLQEAVNSREEFILSFSHETRNPLNGIIGNLQILNDMDLPLKIRQVVNKASICTKILKNILLTILDSKKSGHSATDIQLNMTPVDMKLFIDEVSIVCKDLIQGKGLTPIIEVSPSFPSCVLFDSERITQVILNLVSNAIKFTERGSIKLFFGWNSELQSPLVTDYVTANDIPFASRHPDFLKTRRVTVEEKGKLVISVVDTGHGIKRESLETIFEKFAQVNDKIELKRLGLGLGLWICKTIVALHKGEILVDSQENIGSCFTVEIPTSCVPSHSASRTKFPMPTLSIGTHNTSYPRRSKRVLVVEDFPINRVINAEMLKKYGFEEIEIATNGKEAVKTFKKRGLNFFDLITMDLEMPIMKGKEAIMQMRQYERLMKCEPTRIVIISGNAIEKEIKECTDPEGEILADHFLTKPCDYKTLVTTLEHLGFEQPQMNQRPRKKMKVLFADDDFFNLDIMESFASQIGMDYVVAKNGKEAVEVFAKNINDIQMVFLDCEMPIMNGLDACLEIKELMKKTSVSCPVYLVSGMYSNERLPEGFDGCIQKPFDFETFKKIFS